MSGRGKGNGVIFWLISSNQSVWKIESIWHSGSVSSWILTHWTYCRFWGLQAAAFVSRTGVLFQGPLRISVYIQFWRMDWVKRESRCGNYLICPYWSMCTFTYGSYICWVCCLGSEVLCKCFCSCQSLGRSLFPGFPAPGSSVGTLSAESCFRKLPRTWYTVYDLCRQKHVVLKKSSSFLEVIKLLFRILTIFNESTITVNLRWLPND